MTGLTKCCELLGNNGWEDVSEKKENFGENIVKLYKNEKLGIEIGFFCGEIDAMELIIFYHDNGDNYYIGGFDYYYLVGYMVCENFLPFNFNDK